MTTPIITAQTEQEYLSDLLFFLNKYYFPNKRAIRFQLANINDESPVDNIKSTQLTSYDVFPKLDLVYKSKLPKNCSEDFINAIIKEINKEFVELTRKSIELKDKEKSNVNKYVIAKVDSFKVNSWVYDAEDNWIGTIQVDGTVKGNLTSNVVGKVGDDGIVRDLKKEKKLEKMTELVMQKVSKLSAIVNSTFHHELNDREDTNCAFYERSSFCSDETPIKKSSATSPFFCIEQTGHTSLPPNDNEAEKQASDLTALPKFTLN